MAFYFNGNTPKNVIFNNQIFNNQEVKKIICNTTLIWETSNLWDTNEAEDTNIYINNLGREALGSNGDRFLHLDIDVNSSTDYTFSWQRIVYGPNNYSPYIRISQYNPSGTFISRILCNCSEYPSKKYTFTTDSNAVYIDVRIDSPTSIRGQCLVDVMLEG